jgi:eukaryotic-like serine/threonine-protein kinase
LHASPPQGDRADRMATDGFELAIGDRVGSFRIVGALGADRFAAVHVANPRRALVHVAGLDGWRETAVHVLRTARVVETLGHPGIAPIVERGVLPDRRPWWAAEVPNGVALYDVIARRTMPAGELSELVRDIADVLAHAHARGAVHRALTLRSIVLATGERAFPIAITDWGLRAADLGVYAAPEADADAPADVYALGVIAHRAATRVFPVDRGVGDLGDLPAELASQITRMLALDPAARPTAAELAGRSQPLPERTFPRFDRPKWTPAPPLAVVPLLSIVRDKSDKPEA